MYQKWPHHLWQKMLMFQYAPLMWKLKNDEYRFEQEPFIDINIFGLHFGIKFYNGKYNQDAYWEAMLEHLYDNKSIKECVDDNTWVAHCGTNNKRKENVYLQNMLTKKGRNEYEKEQGTPLQC